MTDEMTKIITVVGKVSNGEHNYLVYSYKKGGGFYFIALP